MNDYGFKPHALVMVISQEGYIPNPTDVYNPNEPNFGNTNFGREDTELEYRNKFNWDLSTWAKTDIRLFYTGRYKMAYS